MTISSSLNAGVTGLAVNATKLATISDNIANSATYGYKGATADFHSLITSQSTGAYSAGGVRVSHGRDVDQKGSLLTTQNPTDLAVTGRGMLPVTTITSVNSGTADLPLRLASTGSFQADANGVLRTTSGEVLLGWPADQDGNIPSYPRDTISSLEAITISADSLQGNPTTEISLGVNLPATDTDSDATGDPRTLPIQYYGNLGESQNLDITFTPTIPASGSSNTWTIEINDDAQSGALIGEFTVVFDDSRDNGGTISSVTAGSAGSYDATTGLLTVTAGGGTMEIDIGEPLEAQGLSQLSNTFSPLSITKNGSAVGQLSSVQVDGNGFLTALYDSGDTRTLYQIPVVDVPYLNGLTPQSNQTFEISTSSGSFYLWDAGDGPVGDISGFAREESTVDVAGELTELIKTQRAYNSNAKVIQTVDEMLQETTNIKR